MSRDTKIHVELLKDSWFLPRDTVITTPSEFVEQSHLFKKGTLFTDEWSDEEKNNKHAPNYGWMYIENAQQTAYKFAHPYKYILDNWANYPELFRER